MQRTALQTLVSWQAQSPNVRKPLVLRGARQVGKSFLVRDFCQKHSIACLELNFEKDPALQALFVDGENSRTVALLETHFNRKFDVKTLLFLDEIQAAPKVFSRLRYFREDTPEIAVIAAGSLLEFTLSELAQAVPVGRIEYLQLGPMRFEEYLTALGEDALLNLIREWIPGRTDREIPDIFHLRLLSLARDFSLVGGMPEAVARFSSGRDFLGCESVQRAILETYQQDFAKFRKRVPLERLQKVFTAIPTQVGRKWVHARVNPDEKALATDAALDALCKARVAHRVFHSSGNGVPLAAERKDNLFKVLFLDVGLMGLQLGLRASNLLSPDSFARVNEGAIAEQWIGQHLLDLRPLSDSPELHYWVREKSGALAEVDFLISQGPMIIPIEVKATSPSRAKSLQVFLAEKKRCSPFGILFSAAPPSFDSRRKMIQLPFYMVEQIPRINKGL